MHVWNILYGAEISRTVVPKKTVRTENTFCTEKRRIVNRKECLKHAVSRAAIALRAVLIPALLLSSRAALMNVQAASEVPVQTEIESEEAVLVPAAETEGAEEGIQAPEETQTAEETQTPEENTAEETQATAEDAAKEAQAAAEDMAEETQAQAQPLSVTMVGDSVMLGASPSILEMMPDCVIDAKVSRQVIQADGVLDALEQQNALRQTVVLALGTNGPFSTATGQGLIDRLGSGRTIYWVTAYGRDLSWQEESNATIRQLAENNENVHIIDWAQAVLGHAEWLCADGIHLNAAGRDAYARIVLGGLL